MTSISSSSTVNGRTTTSVYTRATGETVVTSPAGRVSRTVRDAAGRIIELHATGGDLTSIAWDAQGRISQVERSSGDGVRRTSFG